MKHASMSNCLAGEHGKIVHEHLDDGNWRVCIECGEFVDWTKVNNVLIGHINVRT